MTVGPPADSIGTSAVTVTVGALKETAPGETRVAVTPQSVHRFHRHGVTVLVERDAGAGVLIPDAAYTSAGAIVVDFEELVQRADAVLTVLAPARARLEQLSRGQFLFGLLQARTQPDLVAALREAGIIAVSLDMLPRTLSSAQSMDALTSQANVAGYKSILVAANAYGSYFPMLMTAAGTVRPARVLILGAGVAGLQAIATAHRLGAVVSAYDVRPAARADIESLGASYLDLGLTSADGSGGYARALTTQEQHVQQQALATQIAANDVVITTAQVPGHKPPLLVTADALAAMHPGSVVVDLGASELGGNVAGSVPDSTTVTGGGVTIIGAGHLPAAMPQGASTAYARNISDLVQHFIRAGSLCVDLTDEIDGAVVVTASTPHPITHKPTVEAAK
ncbi:NAD(P) transhydrogenase subunit alpha [Mycolicibacterium fortuitum]|uniref:NAD(P) transhydrogenase subunit alpha n=1 Tax=Mycolicibacterium fortuitum TaxID=1766 RepID=UPI001CE1947B|nr:NAD(P) transhydrogenase subunit alpha [Mycolicibacterium fortuitum]MCA4727290.1 NAD(P) transhydrogenase subunit alpha [Mycolicibacterium fortuitum]